MKKTLFVWLLIVYATMSFGQKKVYFSGTITNCPYTEFEIGSIDKPNDINEWQRVSIKNGNFSVVVPLNDPTVFQCYIKGKKIEFYAMPGDSLVLKTDFTKLWTATEFSGKGTATAQFHTSWKKQFNALHKADRNNRKNNTPEAYLKERKKLRDSELAFLQEYAAKNGLKESSFFKYYTSEFTFSFYSSFANYMYQHNNNIEGNGVKPEYASLVTLLDEIDFDTLDYHETESAQMLYATYINRIKYRQLIYNKTLPPAKMDFVHWLKRTYDLSKEILPKKAHETYVMNMFFEHLNPVSVNRLSPLYEDFIKTCSIENRMKLYNAFNKGIFKEKLTIPSDAYVKSTDATLEEILSDYKGSIVYVDFWASWCAPCIDEVPASKKMQEKFKDKDIKFLFLSIDRDETSWKRAIAAYKIPGIHIRFKKGKISSAIKNLISAGIPRYLIVGRDGKILDNDAKRPSDAKLVADLEKLLNE
ncbi:MAG: TlpA disulfide reductase family protein [Bacteroidota bacterium]